VGFWQLQVPWCSGSTLELEVELRCTRVLNDSLCAVVLLLLCIPCHAATPFNKISRDCNRSPVMTLFFVLLWSLQTSTSLVSVSWTRRALSLAIPSFRFGPEHPVFLGTCGLAHHFLSRTAVDLKLHDVDPFFHTTVLPIQSQTREVLAPISKPSLPLLLHPAGTLPWVQFLLWRKECCPCTHPPPKPPGSPSWVINSCVNRGVSDELAAVGMADDLARTRVAVDLARARGIVEGKKRAV